MNVSPAMAMRDSGDVATAGGYSPIRATVDQNKAADPNMAGTDIDPVTGKPRKKGILQGVGTYRGMAAR